MPFRGDFNSVKPASTSANVCAQSELSSSELPLEIYLLENKCLVLNCPSRRIRNTRLAQAGGSMKIVVLIARILLGLGFLIFGLNILHPFMPQPPMPEGSPEALFMAVMAPSGWMTAVGVFQALGGLMVLVPGTVPIGLTLLGPVLVNILLFHICIMNGGGIAPGLVFTLLEVVVIYGYRGYFAPILTTKAKPS